MNSIFFTEPSHVNVNSHNNYQYNFLSSEKFSSSHFYDIINSHETYKLKNIYYFIYLRLFKINKSHPEINKLLKNEGCIDEYTFNKLIKDFIGGDELYKIIVANAILIYNH